MDGAIRKKNRTATHSIVTDDSIDVPHSIVAGILGPSNRDGAWVALLVNLNICSRTPLELLDCVSLLSDNATYHRSGAWHRLACAQPILQENWVTWV